MTDYTELKRMAEAAKEACGDYIQPSDGGMFVHQMIGRIEACESTEPLCKEERTILLAISRTERDQLKSENSYLKAGCDTYEQIIADLKAENEALRKAVLASREFIMHEAEVRGLLDENNEVSFRHPRRRSAIAVIDAAMGKGALHD